MLAHDIIVFSEAHTYAETVVVVFFQCATPHPMNGFDCGVSNR